MHTIFQVLNWYNLLVGHVGIHGQRRLTEALVKGSLVWQKEYPTESSPQAKKGLSYCARVYAHAACENRSSACVNLIMETPILHGSGYVPQVPVKMMKLIRWIPPICDFSLNVDGACKEEHMDTLAYSLG
ncbi:hypothetical protein Taro_021488 [Colocasia esculenta]|uniref:Uncharacterized protein n=1 Tax=Colocasia esculenta TaxID=4460 RepID=A0A843UZ50_COLES|nr:hypothetical protein [Colocasia esculenta]